MSDGWRRPWCRLWDRVYTTPSHLGLDGVALAVFVRAILLANVRPWDEAGVGWLLAADGRPLSIADLAREARFDEPATARAVASLVACGSLLRGEADAIGVAHLRRWQESPAAERMRRHRARGRDAADAAPAPAEASLAPTPAPPPMPPAPLPPPAPVPLPPLGPSAPVLAAHEWPEGVATEAEWIEAWNALCAERGRIRGIVALGPVDVAALRRLGQPITWWRETLALVAGSSFLRGEVAGFFASARWVIDPQHRPESGRTHHAEDVRSGRYADAGARSTTEAEPLAEAELDTVRAWIAGWSRVSSLAADPPDGGRTRARDAALARWIQRWAGDTTTDGWTAPDAAERAARALAAQASRDPRLAVPSLDRLLRDREGGRLEELLREGDRVRRAKAARPIAAPAPPPPPLTRPSPEAERAAVRAARDILPAALRRRLAPDTGQGGEA